MGVALITRREVKSGDANSSTLLSVIYPTGATCTCTNGSTTLTASDTSGYHIFILPSTGTWTVKAVYQDYTASQAVSITATGQKASATLAFTFVAYDSSNGLSSGYSLGSTYITPAIDITPFTYMSITASRHWAVASGYGQSVGLSTTADGSFSCSRSFVEPTTLTNKIDISKMTGSYYIKFSGPIELNSGYIGISGSAATAGVYNITFS